MYTEYPPALCQESANVELRSLKLSCSNTSSISGMGGGWRTSQQEARQHLRTKNTRNPARPEVGGGGAGVVVRAGFQVEVMAPEPSLDG